VLDHGVVLKQMPLMVKHVGGAAARDSSARPYGSHVVHKNCEKVAITLNETNGRIIGRQSDVGKNIIHAGHPRSRVVPDILQERRVID